MIRRQLSTFRWLNSSLAARSLAEVLTERVLGEIRFQGVAEREVQGDSPRLIVNTTLFNNGRRLVFTTLPRDSMQYDFFHALRESLARRGVAAEISANLMQRWETLLPVTPQDLHLDPCAIRLAAAVAGSASFPPLIGPITFRVGDEEEYWHTGDGGLYKNQGVESILFAFLKKLQARKSRRALIISFDSSYPFSVGARRLTVRAEPFSLFTYDFSRIPSIMEERATAYQQLFFKSLQFEGVFPDARAARVVVIRHTECEVEGRSHRSARGVSRGEAAHGLGRGGTGAHRGDPHALQTAVGVRPAAVGHCRCQGRGAEAARDSRLSRRRVARKSRLSVAQVLSAGQVVRSGSGHHPAGAPHDPRGGRVASRALRPSAPRTIGARRAGRGGRGAGSRAPGPARRYTMLSAVGNRPLCVGRRRTPLR
jgi:hypothetical protein